MANDEVSIGLAERSDAAAVLKLMKQLVLESDTFTVDPSLATLSVAEEAQQIMLVNQTRSNVILLARLNDAVIGVVSVQQLGDSTDGELGVAVLKQFWNHGIGTALVDEALNWGREYSNLERIALTFENRNQAAEHVYQKLGFKVNSKRRVIDVTGSSRSTTEMLIDVK